MQYLTSFYNIPSEWQTLLEEKYSQLHKIDGLLLDLAKNNDILPPQEQIFSALKPNTPNKIKIVIIGQDPYHGDHQANGMSFAVSNELRPLPPSLYNIYAEILLNNLEYDNLPLQAQLLMDQFKTGTPSLKREIMDGLHSRMINQWPQQGVLLLNASLTVIAHQANSLQKIGWQDITSHIIKQISTLNKHCVFMLWGSYAKSLQEHITNQEQHLILTAVHPSPLSAHRGFFGCQHFQQANNFLHSHDITPIRWVSNNIENLFY